MIERITIHMYDKLRALYLADYLAVYGVEVSQIVISVNGRCVISIIGDKTHIMNIVYQFHEDY